MAQQQQATSAIREEVVIPEGFTHRLRTHFNSSPNERVTFLWGEKKNSATGARKLAKYLMEPEDRDYERSSWGNVRLSQKYVNREFAKAESRGVTLIATIHSQPMVFPSSGDIRTHREVVKVYPDQLTGTFCNDNLTFFRDNGRRHGGRALSSR